MCGFVVLDFRRSLAQLSASSDIATGNRTSDDKPEHGVQDLPRTRGLAPPYDSPIFGRQRRRTEVGMGETLKSAKREPFWAVSHTMQQECGTSTVCLLPSAPRHAGETVDWPLGELLDGHEYLLILEL
jgi:hypothetical protein